MTARLTQRYEMQVGHSRNFVGEQHLIVCRESRQVFLENYSTILSALQASTVGSGHSEGKLLALFHTEKNGFTFNRGILQWSPDCM